MAATEPMARIANRDRQFQFVDLGAHYDGVYFYAIALDPFATGQEHLLIDRAAYRYGHPGYGWLAGLLSLRRPDFIPLALLVLSLVGLFVGGVAASLLSTELDGPAWAGLAVALNPGLIYAITVDTSEAVGAALLMSALLAWARRRHVLASLLLIALSFAKEPLVLVPVGLALWETLETARHKDAQHYVRRMLAVLPGPTLYVTWALYLSSRFGTWPFQQGQDVLSVPLTGWLDTLSRAAGMATSSFESAQLGQAAVPLLAVMLAALALGVVRALRFRSLLDPVFLLLAGLALSVGWLALLYPKDLIRTLAFPLLVFTIALMCGRSKQRLASLPLPTNRERHPTG
jgi:hypothetical protein